MSSEDLDHDHMEEEDEEGEDEIKSTNHQNVRHKCSKHASVVSLCSDVEEVEDVVTPVDHEDGGHFVNNGGGDLDMSYSSGESEASSEFSALRFRDSPFSSSSR